MLALYKIPQKNFYFALPSSAHVFLKMCTTSDGGGKLAVRIQAGWGVVRPQRQMNFLRESSQHICR